MALFVLQLRTQAISPGPITSITRGIRGREMVAHTPLEAQCGSIRLGR